MKRKIVILTRTSNSNEFDYWKSEDSVKSEMGSFQVRKFEFSDDEIYLIHNSNTEYDSDSHIQTIANVLEDLNLKTGIGVIFHYAASGTTQANNMRKVLKEKGLKIEFCNHYSSLLDQKGFWNENKSVTGLVYNALNQIAINAKATPSQQTAAYNDFWNYFNSRSKSASLLNEKLNLLHDIYSGEKVEISKYLKSIDSLETQAGDNTSISLITKFKTDSSYTYNSETDIGEFINLRNFMLDEY